MAYTVTDQLTTIFTPPASCNTQWTYEPEYYNSVAGGILIQNALSAHPDTKCFPLDFQGFGRAPSVVQVYSPGACPMGYQTAGNTFNGATTTAICCPTDFSYMVTYSSINFFSTAAEFNGCISMFQSDANPTQVVCRTNNEDLTSTVITGPISMWAQPISVAYRQADLGLFTTASSSPSSSTSTPASTPSSTAMPVSSSTPTIVMLPAAATTAAASQSVSSSKGAVSSSSTAQSQSAAAATSSAQPTPSQSTDSSISTLSTGTIAGAAIGAAAVLGLLIGLAIFFRRRRTRTPPNAHTAVFLESDMHARTEKPQQWPPAELSGHGQTPYWSQPHEMPSQEKLRKHVHNSAAVELG